MEWWITLWMLTVPIVGYMFSLCCCPQADCDFCTDTPTQFQVTLAGIANGSCTGCGLLNATWTLDLDQSLCDGSNAGPNCGWTYTDSSAFCTGADADTTCIDLTQIFTTPNYFTRVRTRYDDGAIFGGVKAGEAYFKSHGTSAPDCASFSAFDIPFSSEESGLCIAASSTCTITAVP